MNENIDLTKILKNCPIGWKFYSSVYGDVTFLTIDNSPYPIKIIRDNREFGVSKDGKHIKDIGECTFFPSKKQRNWSKFTAPWYKKFIEPKFKVGDRIRHKETNKDDVYEIRKVYDDSYGIAGFTWMINMKYQDQYELVPNKFDPKTLKPFDKVLVKHGGKEDKWICNIFSFYNEGTGYDFECLDDVYENCIPYNDDTKHLIGTTDEAPEYYRY